MPPVDELIAFMRQKSSNICTVAKKGDPAPLSKEQKRDGTRPPLTKPKVSINVIDSTPQVTQSLPAGSQVSQGSVKPKGKGYSKSFGKGSAVESLGSCVSPKVVSPTQGAYPRSLPLPKTSMCCVQWESPSLLLSCVFGEEHGEEAGCSNGTKIV